MAKNDRGRSAQVNRVNDSLRIRQRQMEEVASVSDLFHAVSDRLAAAADIPTLLGYKPHPKQEEFHRLQQQARVMIGGNRSGKSVAGIVEDLWTCTHRHPYRVNVPGPVRGRVIAQSFIDGIDRVILPIIKNWILPSDLINGSWEDSFSDSPRAGKVLTFANKSFIEFMSYEQATMKFAGTSRHFIHFDEEPPKAIFQENMQRLIDTNGSWWMTLTPTEGMTWLYYEMLAPDVRLPSADLGVIEVLQQDNPFLSEEGRRNANKFLTEDERRVRESGEFVPKGGLIFSKFTNEFPYVIKPFKPPPDWPVYVSVDNGWKNPTAVVWHAVNPKGGQIISFHELYHSFVTIPQTAAMIHQYNKENNILPELYTGDPAMKQTSNITGTSPQMEYAMNGIPLALDGIPKAVNHGLLKLQTYFLMRPVENRPTWQITEDCISLRKELLKYAWRTYASAKLNDTLNAPEEPVKKDDHAIDSSRYFITLVLPELPTRKMPNGDMELDLPENSSWNLFAGRGMPEGGTYKPLRLPPQRRMPGTTWSDSFEDNIEGDGWSYGL